MHEQIRELRLEDVGVGLGGEVGPALARRVARPLLFGSDADRMRQTVDELTHARLARVLVAVQPGLTEVLGDGDVCRELAPARRHLGAVHTENDASVGVGDRARATLVNHGVERVGPRHGMAALETHPAGAARGWGLTWLFRAWAFVVGSFGGGPQPAPALY